VDEVRILEEDLKRGLVKLRVDNLNDIYWLASIIEEGDLITMKTLRRVKQEGIRADSGERIPMILTIEVDKVKLDPYSSRLRISGVVRVGPDKFGIQGQHHTFSVDEGSSLTIVKKEWRKTHLEILKRAESMSEKGEVLLVAMDDEGATIAKAGSMRVEEIAYIRSRLPSKMDTRGREGEERRYFSEILDTLRELYSKIKPRAIVVGGPGFFKDRFLSYARAKDPEMGEKMREGDASNATFSGVLEMIRRGEADKVLRELDLAKDMAAVEEIFELLSKNSDLVTYGVDEVLEAVNQGAAEIVLISASVFFDPDMRDKVFSLIEGCERTRAEFRIIDSTSEPGEKLDAIGGVAAKLRYRI
jgi:protein pelota